VVIRSPLFVAAIPPAADVAMLDRFRIAACEQRIGATCQRLEQPPANEPDIGRIISDSILVNRERRAWGDHKKPIGHETLDLAKQVSVERELQDRTATRFASEFGVVRLVVEISEGRVRTGRCRRLAENVRVPNPPLPGERALINHIDAGLERRDCRLHTRLLRPVLRHFEHGESARAKVLNVSTLMCGAALTKKTGVLVEEGMGDFDPA
jgi:hypothetical protein